MGAMEREGGAALNANIYGESNKIVKTCNAVYLGLIDSDGYPSVSTVTPIKQKNILEVYFACGKASNKYQRLLANNRASICFQAGYNNITLVGETQIITDQDTKSKYWLDMFNEHFTDKTDPNYILVKFKTNRVSLWVDNESAEFSINALMKVQS
jgi:general stress protein 26